MGSAVTSASTTISIGPASESMLTRPLSLRQLVISLSPKIDAPAGKGLEADSEIPRVVASDSPGPMSYLREHAFSQTVEVRFAPMTLVPEPPAELVADVVERPDQNPAIVYLNRLAPGSRRTMRQALDAIADLVSNGQLEAQTFPWEHLRYQHTQAIRAQLSERLAVATTNKHLAALRGVLKEAWRLGLMPAEDYNRASDVENVKESKLPAGRHVEIGEISALAAVCRDDPKPAGARDGAMLGVAFAAGLRVGELVSLMLADVNPETGEVMVRRGKGAKQRTAYLQHGALAALQDWLRVRKLDEGPLFCPVNQAGKVTVRALTTQAVYERFQLRARQAGLSLSFSPHDGRRTWIGNLLDAGADISTVQQLAGHASVSTTARYDRRGERAKQQAAALLHFPWGDRSDGEG
jgi:site-specific recombinase XerD